MKHLILACLVLTACSVPSREVAENGSGEAKQDSVDNGYRTELDTSYKPNSTEVDYVTQTFYRKGEPLAEYTLTLSSVIGDSVIRCSVQTGEVFLERAYGTLQGDARQFEKFFCDLDTVRTYWNRHLQYDIQLKGSGGKIEAGDDSGTVEFFMLDGDRIATTMDLTETDIRNMRNAVRKFLNS